MMKRDADLPGCRAQLHLSQAKADRLLVLSVRGLAAESQGHLWNRGGLDTPDARGRELSVQYGPRVN